MKNITYKKCNEEIRNAISKIVNASKEAKKEMDKEEKEKEYGNPNRYNK